MIVTVITENCILSGLYDQVANTVEVLELSLLASFPTRFIAEPDFAATFYPRYEHLRVRGHFLRIARRKTTVPLRP